MKILKRGEFKSFWPVTKTCTKCKSKLQVNEKDCQDARDRVNEPVVWMFNCPVCNDVQYINPKK